MIKKYRGVLFFAIILLYIYLRGIGDHGLFDPIEGVNASISLNMLSHYNYLTPKIGAIDFAGKTLGAWQLGALSLGLFGWTEFSVRFWPAIAGVLIALSAALSAQSKRGAWFAALIASSMTLCFTASQIASSYTLYSCCMGFALAGFIKLSRYKNSGAAMAFFASVSAFIIHGSEGLIMPWLTLLLFSLLIQDYNILKSALKFRISSAIAIIALFSYILIIIIYNPLLLTLMTYKAPVLINYDFIASIFFILFAFTPWTGFLLQAIWDASIQTVALKSKNSQAVNIKISDDFYSNLFMAFWFLMFFIIGVLSGDLFMLTACVPAAGALIGNSLDEWLETGRVTTIQGAAAGNALILILALAIGIPAALHFLPILKDTTLSLIPWGFFILIFIIVNWYFSRKRQIFRLSKFSMITALACLMPLTGVFDLAANNFTLRESGLMLRDTIHPQRTIQAPERENNNKNILIQYGVHRPSLYFYALADYVLSDSSPLISGVASKNFTINDDKLSQVWPDDITRYFLVLSKEQNFIPPLPSDVYYIVELDREKIIILSNR